MYPKTFFERFWGTEQKDELFVCMPFHSDFDARFKLFDEAAKEAGFIKAIRVKEDSVSGEIKTSILSNIADSKIILVDLSDDPKTPCQYARHINGNVLYEAGIAHSMRGQEAVVLVRDCGNFEKVDFDVKGMNIHVPLKSGEFTKEWLVSLLKETRKSYDWSQEKRVKSTAESIDEGCLSLMLDIGSRPDGYNHFNREGFEITRRFSVLRLMDLGILWFNTGKERNPGEYAYHWTSFGYEVMNYLKIKRLTTEKEFEESRPRAYLLAKEANKKWVENEAKRKELEGRKISRLM